MKNLFFTLIFLGLCFQLTAQVNWTGGAGTTDWNTAGNWDTGIPTSTDEVIIDDETVVLSGTATVLKLNLLQSSNLTIDAGATLTVDGFMDNDDGFEVNNSAMVTNNGTLNVSNINGATATSADGLYVRGTFINNGSIVISNIAQHGLFIQRGNFTNNIGATINISSSGVINGDGDNLYVDDSGSTLGLLTNNGTITITTTLGADDGIYINDNSSIDNNATITISGGGKNGIRIDDGGTFNNNTGANFSVDGGTDDQIFLDNTGSEFINNGTVTLTNGDAGDASLYVTDNGKFTNNVSSIVNISGSDNYSMQLDANANAAPATIDNFGTINVNGGSNDGLRIQENGVFNNQAGGTVSFTSCGEEAIKLSSSDPGNDNVFNNNGTIHMLNIMDHGIEIIDGTFNNNSGGLITGDNCADDGIRMQDLGLFNNDGAIRIDGSGSEDIETETVTSFVNTTNATFAPGSSPGDLEIRDDFDLGASTTTFEINGLSPITDYDQIINTTSANTLTISASSKIILEWGFAADAGDCFTIIDGSGLISGTFDLANVTNVGLPAGLDFEINYINSNAIPTEVQVCLLAPLPVELVEFSGEKTDRGSELSWVTANEENNAYFEVEYSINGRDFSMLDKVEGNGVSSIAQNYTFVHKNPANGDNYYRLKQVDFNGNFEYSNIVYLRSAMSETLTSIYPNPAQDIITYEGAPATLTFYDIYGRAVMQLSTVEEKANLDISTLEIGIYMIEVSSNTKQKTFERFVKK